MLVLSLKFISLDPKSEEWDHKGSLTISFTYLRISNHMSVSNVKLVAARRTSTVAAICANAKNSSFIYNISLLTFPPSISMSISRLSLFFLFARQQKWLFTNENQNRWKMDHLYRMFGWSCTGLFQFTQHFRSLYWPKCSWSKISGKRHGCGQ